MRIITILIGKFLQTKRKYPTALVQNVLYGRLFKKGDKSVFGRYFATEKALRCIPNDHRKFANLTKCLLYYPFCVYMYQHSGLQSLTTQGDPLRGKQDPKPQATAIVQSERQA